MQEARYRTLGHLLIALLLLCGQQAAQLHALSHSGQDLNRVAGREKGAPPVGHPAAQCLLYHAIDSVLPNPAFSLEPVCVAPPAPLQVALPLPLPPRTAFDSRAPPVLS